MRTYKPHERDAIAAKATLWAFKDGRLPCSSDEADSLRAVIAAYNHDGDVTQHDICRAHDAIARFWAINRSA